MGLWQDIMNDSTCWDCTRIAPPSYYLQQHMYAAQEQADFSTMRYLTFQKVDMRPNAISSWQKWKALYMFGENLTQVEQLIRQVIAARFAARNRLSK